MPTGPRITINGRFLTQRASGVQRFAMEAIKAIDALLDRDYAALKGRIELMAPRQARDFPLRNIPLRRSGFFSGYLWEQLEFPMHAAGRVLLNLCMLGPLVTRHQLVVVHDATVRALPNNFSSRFRAVYGFLLPRLCRRAEQSMTVSEFSRQEIGKWYGADITRLPICHEGGDHMTAVAADPAVLKKFDLVGRKFFLGVGVDSANKNIATVVKAFNKAKLDDTVLVLTGAKDPKVFGQIDPIQSDAVRMVGFIPDSESAHALRARARAGFSLLLRRVRLAAAGGHDLRLPGDHQRATGTYRGLRRRGAALPCRRCRLHHEIHAGASFRRRLAHAALGRRQSARAAVYLGRDRALLARPLPGDERQTGDLI